MGRKEELESKLAYLPKMSELVKSLPACYKARPANTMKFSKIMEERLAEWCEIERFAIDNCRDEDESPVEQELSKKIFIKYSKLLDELKVFNESHKI